jgi:hypothetical protein
VTEDANIEVAAAMAVRAATEDSLLDSELALEEAMEVMEATVMDSGAPVVALAVTRAVGRSSAKPIRAAVNINNRMGAATNNMVGAATSSRVMVVTVVVVETHVSVP